MSRDLILLSLIIVRWNVRGLGRPGAAIRRLVRTLKVDLLLQETKTHSDVESIVFSVWGSRRCGWDCVPLEVVKKEILMQKIGFYQGNLGGGEKTLF